MKSSQAQPLRTACQRLRDLESVQKEVDDLGERLIRIGQEASFYRRLPPDQNGDVEEMRRTILKRYETEMDIYARRRAALEQELCVLTEYIDSIPDSTLRQIFTLRYIDRLTWQQVSIRLDAECEDTLRIRHNRYLEKYPLPDKEERS